MATMNSTKEMRNGTKAQRKSIKANKKQQLKQQQQQNQQQTDAETTTATSTTSNPAHYSVNKLTGKTTKIPTNTNNNNNNIILNNNNINQKLRVSTSRPLNTTQSSMSLPMGTINPPGYENAPKLERANSFSLRGKLSKLLNSITGSKENLTKVDDENATPYKFTRSRSMILLRRSNRRSLIEPQLEQLSEETDPTSPSSPRKNSMEITDLLPPTTTSSANKSFTNSLPLSNGATPATITPHRHSVLPLTSTPVEEESTVVHLRRKPSNISLPAGDGSGELFNPIANFQRRRSNTLLASFKSTIANITGDKKRDKLNPKWSASLQSLQAIDNMVSYENMSFIDYDKFNGYEKQLERQLSTLSLRAEQNPPLTPTAINHSPLSVPVTVVRRRKSSTSRQLANQHSRSRGSFNFDTDYEHNLDKPRNVYRDSLDSRKLERLNDFSRNSFILDKEIVDWLNLEDGCPRKKRTDRHTQQANVDTVDSAAVVQFVSSTVFVALALFGLVNAGYIPHGHATSYASLVQHDVHPHKIVHAVPVHYVAPVIHGHEHYEHEPHHYPKYSFDYGVQDAHTGDHKSQWEHRDGDHVKGGYTLAESDGTTRVVEYTADDHSGFNAVVKKIGHAHHPQVYYHKEGYGYGGHGLY